MLASRVSSKGQVTLPKKVREIMGVKAGDSVIYEIEGDVVKLRRTEPIDIAFHSALSSTLDEWTTKEDGDAFRDL